MFFFSFLCNSNPKILLFDHFKLFCKAVVRVQKDNSPTLIDLNKMDASLQLITSISLTSDYNYHDYICHTMVFDGLVSNFNKTFEGAGVLACTFCHFRTS